MQETFKWRQKNQYYRCYLHPGHDNWFIKTIHISQDLQEIPKQFAKVSFENHGKWIFLLEILGLLRILIIWRFTFTKRLFWLFLDTVHPSASRDRKNSKLLTYFRQMAFIYSASEGSWEEVQFETGRPIKYFEGQ